MVDWIKQLNEVTREDLEAVKSRLNELNDEATALRQLKAVFQAKLGMNSKPEPAQAAVKPHKPPASAWAPPPAASTKGTLTAQQREAAAKFLMKNGPRKPAEVCAECDIPPGSSTYVFNHPWFDRTERGIMLTQEGKQAATAAA